MRLVKEHGHSSICRRSIIQSDDYRKLNIVNGQDLGALYLEVLELPGKGDNYMAYRTVEGIPDRRRRRQQGVRAGGDRAASRARRDEGGAGAGDCRPPPRRNRALSGRVGFSTAERRQFHRFALAPSLIVLFAIAGCRRSICVVTSLTPFQLTEPGSATNFSSPLRNYSLLPGDPRFVNSLWVQAKLSFWGVLFQVLFGMLLALLLNVPSRFVEFARTFS